MSSSNAMMTRMVRREIGRRFIDSSRLDVKVVHGTVYLRGQISRLRGHDLDLDVELDTICRILRQRQGIRDVIVDVTKR